MESSSKTTSIPVPVLVVLYDFRYLWKDNREISVKKGEKLLLIEKTNKDWWQVVRPTERKSFFVPAQYVEPIAKKRQEKEGAESLSGFSGDDSVLYENLDSLKHQISISSLSRMCKSDVIGTKLSRDEGGKSPEECVRQKPVPKTRTKVSVSKSVDDGIEVTKLNAADSKCSFIKGMGSDNVDNTNASDKIKQDFILSLPKELSSVHDGNKNYRGKSKPIAVENSVYCNVPSEENKSCIARQKVKSGGYPNKVNVDIGKNRMKNSYNLKTKPSKTFNEPHSHTTGDKNEIQQRPPLKNEKLQYSQNFSKSLEKLAEEIQFEPKKVTVTSKVSSSSSSADNYKTKAAKMPKDILEKKPEKKGKSNDASIVLDENKMQPQSRSVFSRFRRSLHHSNSFKSNNLKKLGKNSKKACELSLSWEGGLDKIQEKKENKEKPPVTPLGLQRSRTFMFAERSPLSVRPANKIFSGKHRLDTAYHSQRKPDEKVTLSTFKPIFNLDVTHGSIDIAEKKLEKEFDGKHSSDREKFVLGSFKEKKSNETSSSQDKKNEIELRSNVESNNSIRVNHAKKCVHENVTKAYKSTAERENPLDYQAVEQGEGLAFYSEPYCSNSESEDNLEEKSIVIIANKSLRSQSSIDSNLTVSEGTEASESDENSLEFALENPKHVSHQPVNKRRTSLVRNSRVSYLYTEYIDLQVFCEQKIFLKNGLLIFN